MSLQDFLCCTNISSSGLLFPKPDKVSRNKKCHCARSWGLHRGLDELSMCWQKQPIKQGIGNRADDLKGFPVSSEPANREFNNQKFLTCGGRFGRWVDIKMSGGSIKANGKCILHLVPPPKPISTRSFRSPVLCWALR